MFKWSPRCKIQLLPNSNGCLYENQALNTAEETFQWFVSCPHCRESMAGLLSEHSWVELQMRILRETSWECLGLNRRVFCAALLGTCCRWYILLWEGSSLELRVSLRRGGTVGREKVKCSSPPATFTSPATNTHIQQCVKFLDAF